VSLTRRALLIVALTALLAIVGLWGADADRARLWLVPAALLMLGLALEGIAQRRTQVEVQASRPARARLGRPVALVLTWRSLRRAVIRFMADSPSGIETPAVVQTLTAGPDGTESRHPALPVGLGRFPWPAIRGRVRGALGLAWWTRRFNVPGDIVVEPDLLGHARSGRAVAAAGVAQRAIPGSGSELHELRDYRHGDPLRSIDWKASARRSRWIARDRYAEQHLEIMLVIDVGRTSGVSVDRLTRLGHYVNAACRFAEHAIGNEDRVGLVTFADTPLLAHAPGHGIQAVRRLRASLASAASLPRESNALPAAARVLALCRQRALVVFMLDLDDAGSHGQLGQAVRLLAPKHLPVVCGLLSPELYELRDAPARRWLDPYLSLAAAEQIERLRKGAGALRQQGAPVVLAHPAQFEEAVFGSYDRMRARRRI
jgi:uncharacterized protein (DUF58 family)